MFPNPERQSTPPSVPRRTFLGAMASMSAVVLASPALVLSSPDERALSFVHTHTGEHVALTYFAGGAYLSESLARLDRFLRDHRTGDVHPIDPSLFDLLHELRGATRARAPFQVISCYRSPRTNRKLRAAGGGVAKGSLHLQGRAIDVRVSGVTTSYLRDAAKELRRGGVGYYRDSDFIHVDTGRLRFW